MGAFAELGELVQVVTEPVDRKDLTVLGGIGPEGIGRRSEEYGLPIEVENRLVGIHTQKGGELEQVLAIDEENLHDRRDPVVRILRLSGLHQSDGGRLVAGNDEGGNDLAARQRHRKRSRLGLLRSITAHGVREVTALNALSQTKCVRAEAD